MDRTIIERGQSAFIRLCDAAEESASTCLWLNLYLLAASLYEAAKADRVKRPDGSSVRPVKSDGTPMALSGFLRHIAGGAVNVTLPDGEVIPIDLDHGKAASVMVACLTTGRGALRLRNAGLPFVRTDACRKAGRDSWPESLSPVQIASLKEASDAGTREFNSALDKVAPPAASRNRKAPGAPVDGPKVVDGAALCLALRDAVTDAGGDVARIHTAVNVVLTAFGVAPIDPAPVKPAPVKDKDKGKGKGAPVKPAPVVAPPTA